MKKIRTFNEFVKQKNLMSLNTERFNVSRQIWEMLRSEHLDIYFRKPVMLRIDNQRIRDIYFDQHQDDDFYQQEVGWFEGVLKNNKPSFVCPWKFSKEFQNCNFEVLEFIVNKGINYSNYYDKYNSDVCIKFQPYDTEKRVKRDCGILRYSIEYDVWYWDVNYMGKLMNDEVSGDVARFISLISTTLNPETKYTMNWFISEPEEIK